MDIAERLLVIPQEIQNIENNKLEVEQVLGFIGEPLFLSIMAATKEVGGGAWGGEPRRPVRRRRRRRGKRQRGVGCGGAEEAASEEELEFGCGVYMLPILKDSCQALTPFPGI
ncbi:hypothetical protein DAI22_05g049700 [Oryza sativa Japonica Group]|nr:hypothetical protein DAI22_05g049700 [Oryza sativa Japonica Group]